jgi:hypothetical protein
MAIQPKIVISPLRMRSLIKIPQAVIEEAGLTKGSNMQVYYGKNYSAVVILPMGIKLQDRQAERINIIVNEPLI